MLAASQNIPVTILSGYLGAGKTTLLNAILVYPQGLHIFALVNDFGEVNLDAELISQVTDDVISLKNGCACCSLGNDLSRALDLIMTRQAASGKMIDAVIIEASGVANLGRLSSSIANYPGFVLNQSLTLIDAQAINALLKNKFVATTAAEQIASADQLIINRCDEDVGLIAAKLRSPAPATVTTTELLDDLPMRLGVNSLNTDSTVARVANTRASRAQPAISDHQLTAIFIPVENDVDLDQLKLILDNCLNQDSENLSGTSRWQGTACLMRLKGTIVSGRSLYSVQLSQSGYEIKPSEADVSIQGLQCIFCVADATLTRRAALVTRQLRDWSANRTAL